jgi:hemoglobin-like flavoprotein
MGSSPSTTAAIARAAEQLQNEQAKKTEEEIAQFVMPIFYTKDQITTEELAAATAAWKLIVNNKAKYFLAKKAADPDRYPMMTCMEYFYDVFYNRLFDVHPSCKPLFKKSINRQGSFFVRMVSMLLGDVADSEKWFKTLDNLANIHNKMGVKAVEWGITGEVVVYAVQQCLGPDIYTPAVHRGFTKFYSRILDIVIPSAVHFELEHKEFARQVATKRAASEGLAGQSMFTVASTATTYSAAASAAEEMRTVHSARSEGSVDASAHTMH